MTSMRMRGALSWEASAKLAMISIQNTTYCSRDTATVSTRGGSASLKIVQTTANVDAMTGFAPGADTAFANREIGNETIAMGTGTWLDGEKYNGLWALSFDWYTGSTPTGGDGNVLHIVTSGAASPFDVRLYWRKSDGKLEWFKQTTTGTHSAGTSLGAGTKVFATNTWYRLWVWLDLTAGAGTGNLTFTVYWGEINATGFVKDASVSPANNSQYACTPYLGGPTDSATAPGWTTYFDNAVIYDNAADGEFQDPVILLVSVSGESSTINWTPSTGTTHYVLVDELPENGSGTTDSDLVGWITPQADEQFVMTATQSNKYQNPRYIVQAYWHRNASGAKWAAANNAFLSQFQGTQVVGGSPTDPGSSYTPTSTQYRRGKASGKLELADIPSMEFGMRHGSGDSPDWRVSTVAGEVAWERIAAVQPVFM